MGFWAFLDFIKYIFIIIFYATIIHGHLTALHIACLKGNVEIVRLLLSHDEIDVNTKMIFDFYLYNSTNPC